MGTARLDQPAVRHAAALTRIDARAYTIPTDSPESDGTLTWDSTTLVVVHAAAGGTRALGYTYADASIVGLIDRQLAPLLIGKAAADVERAYDVMQRAVRNLGRQGLAATAISAVDIALWNLKATLLDLPLVSLVGAARDAIPVYGSGGFTSYPPDRLRGQLGGWAAAGFPAVKMKIGRDPRADRERVRQAREAVGPDVELFVDANGAYDRKLALAQAVAFSEQRVTWFEEPVSSDDLEGLRLLRDRAPAGMAVAAGEYGYEPQYFRRMLEAGAVDVLQADATRCGGVTGFLRANALCDAWCVPLSAHTAPTVHAHVCCAASRASNLEYFHDHARIEQMLFEGALEPAGGRLCPDRSRPGLGITFRDEEAQRFAL